MNKIAVINGPNINLLGTREVETYGKCDLETLNKHLIEKAKEHHCELLIKQSNHEGELVDFIQNLKDKIDFIIINPAALTHTSIAIRDALLAINKPFIEVHLSNIYKRESFRKKSYFTDIAVGMICGLGIDSYRLALEYAIEFSSRKQ